MLPAVVDTGLHAKGWTVAEACAYMGTHTAASSANIDAEVKRYATWPGQATGYKMGEIEIRRLRNRFTARVAKAAKAAKAPASAVASAAAGSPVSSMSAKKPVPDVRAFHDLVLLNGSLPLSVVSELVEEFLDEYEKECNAGDSAGDSEVAKPEMKRGGEKGAQGAVAGGALWAGAACGVAIVATIFVATAASKSRRNV